MYRSLRDDLHMPVGMLFVNRLHQGGMAAADVERLAIAAQRSRDESERQVLQGVVARAREEIAWSALNARYRARLAAEIDLPIIDFPFVFAEEFGFTELRSLAAQLATAATPSTRKAGRS
jgi:hypothetical protein